MVLIYYETQGTLPGATPVCFDKALLCGKFCCQPLLLLEKFKAISQGGVLNRLNGNQNSEGERTYVLNQPPTFKVDS